MSAPPIFDMFRDAMLHELGELPGHALVVHTTPAGLRRWVLYEPGHPNHPDRNETP